MVWEASKRGSAGSRATMCSKKSRKERAFCAVMLSFCDNSLANQTLTSTVVGMILRLAILSGRSAGLVDCLPITSSAASSGNVYNISHSPLFLLINAHRPRIRYRGKNENRRPPLRHAHIHVGAEEAYLSSYRPRLVPSIHQQTFSYDLLACLKRKETRQNTLTQ